MPTAQNNQLDDDPLALIATYGKILAQFGPRSKDAEDFLRGHPGRDDLFRDLTEAALRLKESAKIQEKNSRDQDQFLKTRIRDRQQIFVLFLVLLLISVTGTCGLAFLLYNNEINKNLQILEFTNQAITPFVYYKIPMSQHDNQDTLSIYEGVEELAKRLPPKDNLNVWSKKLLYAWARSALVKWQNADPPASREWLEALGDRIRYIRDKYPDYARIYSLEAQSEMWQAKLARDKMAKIDDKPSRIRLKVEIKTHYERSVELNRKAIAIENDLTLAHNNLAIGLLRLGSLADDQAIKMKNLEAARSAAEKAVAQGKPLFLLGQESTFATYLDTLGDCYDALLSVHEAMDQPEKQKNLERRKELIVRAFPIYTEIRWNYYGVDFKGMKGQNNANPYEDYAKKNQERLDKLSALVRELKITNLLLNPPPVPSSDEPIRE